MDSVINTNVYLSISYKTVNIQVKRLKIISKYINQGHSMHYHSKTGSSFCTLQYQSLKLKNCYLDFFLWSSPVKALKEIIEPPLENNKSVAENSNVFSEFKADLGKIKMAISHALCSPTYRSGRAI